MSEIKKCFVSRWGEAGRIVEVDFSQLEVVIGAVLSNDPMLIDDILSGKDMHCMSASFLFGVDYDEVFRLAKIESDPLWVKRRKQAKGPSFQLQYGAGAAGIAKKCELPLEQAKQFVENYYGRYSILREWQESCINEVVRGRRPTALRSKLGYPVGESFLHGPLGRSWYFLEEDSLQFMRDRGEYTSFKPTTIKNYPVQGTAFDLVACAIGNLVYALWADDELRDGALLINTVHDSVLLDVKQELVDKAIPLVEEVLTSAPNSLKMNFPLPIKVESSVGLTWGDM